ncbi:hypothetical protein Patl1_32349 [Pistacia atlantica]|uniref:Uncharacterized protein n=1 Tax=Pistacia atlantica TaxID=434234 RepID=A0ACC1AMZ8_9ROSI|nr:hypothetical protein Patl1_32349 [Pistacia atlantica]
MSTLVMEFYANFHECQNGKVYVRGVQVPCDANVINVYYGLENVENVENDEYVDFLHNGDYDEAIQRIIKLKILGRLLRMGEKSFLGTSLNTDTHIWKYFACSRMILITHYSSIYSNKAVLLYSI